MATAAESRVTVIRRWLQNQHVDVWSMYEPISQHVLRDWSTATAYIILDGVMVYGARWQIFRVSLQHGCRAIPLAWVMLPGKGVTQVERLALMLTRVATLLRQRVKHVIFLADRGFRDCDWAELCVQLEWQYAIGVPCNTYITLVDGRYGRIDAMVPYKKNRYFQSVWLTQQRKLCTNLSVTWRWMAKDKPKWSP